VKRCRRSSGGGTVRIPPQALTFADFCNILDRENVKRLALTPMRAQEVVQQLPETGRGSRGYAT